MSRTLKYTVIDAFTNTVFGGNPAAVIVLPNNETLDAQTMQLIAREFNLSETAFVTNKSEAEKIDRPDSADQGSKVSVLGLRWFTPRTEAAICGHATLAAAHAIFSTSASNGIQLDILHFETLSGTLIAERVTTEDGNKIQLEFPAGLTTPVDDVLAARTKRALEGALGGAVHEVAYIGVGSGVSYGDYMLIELAAPFSLAGAEVNAGAFLDLGPEHSVIMLTTASSNAGGERLDYISRVFVPFFGIPEDPVTGSAQCMLGPYWTLKLHGEAAGMKRLRTKQVSERGGDIDVVWDREKGTCKLIGEAVTSREGTLYY